MRYALRLACGLTGATLLLLAGATAAFAADPVVTVDGSGGTSSNGSAVADTGTSNATATFGANAPTRSNNGTDGAATVTFGGNAPTTSSNGTDGTATATFGGNAPSSTADDANGNASVTFGGNAPTTSGNGTDGTATATFGGNAPSSTADDANGNASVTFGGTPPTTDGAPGDPATGGGSDGLSQAFGVLSAVGSGGAPGGSPGSDGSGGQAANGSGGQAAGGAGNLPETSTEALAGVRSSGFPLLALVMSLLVGWLVARRGSVSSAR
jgi:hypothetical protein